MLSYLKKEHRMRAVTLVDVVSPRFRRYKHPGVYARALMRHSLLNHVVTDETIPGAMWRAVNRKGIIVIVFFEGCLGMARQVLENDGSSLVLILPEPAYWIRRGEINRLKRDGGIVIMQDGVLPKSGLVSEVRKLQKVKK